MFCIKHTDFKEEKLAIGEVKSMPNYNINHITYNYGDNNIKDFNFLTNYINISGYRSNKKTNSHNLKFYSNDPDLLKIYNNIKEIYNNSLIHNKLEVINEDSSESSGNLKLSDSPDNQDKQDNNKIYEPTVPLYFINNISQITLIPSKKSEMQEYQLSKIENCNEIYRYFPGISNHNHNHNDNNLICGRFTINVSIINNKPRFTIINSAIKYKATYTDNMVHYSVYNNKLNIEL